MIKLAGEWRTLVGALAGLLSSRRNRPGGTPQQAPRILALVQGGPSRLLLQSVSRDAGWSLTLHDNSSGIASLCQSGVPPIVIYDRELSPSHWSEMVWALTRKSPRPYVILLSPNADTNLWDELQRVGGSDILRTPVNRDSLMGALKRACQLWRNQQVVRPPLHKA